MLERLSNYMEDKKFKITIGDNYLHIINYTRIITLEKEFISLKSNQKKIIIKGKNLTLEKIKDQEMLIKGTIQLLEV
ncbi:MAG: YabP/YqfC family sporulation protein, partial [Bacilli bacterium]|nr:YabP/YqfC family sporulation protein [Bacilli bacterium]